MARKRQIDPTIWTSEQFITLWDVGARLLFIGMFSHADDEGRLKGSPLHLKASVFPADEIPLETIKEWRDKIAGQGLIQIYTNANTEYIVLPTFGQYQYITKRQPSRLPAPREPVHNQVATAPEPVHNQVATAPAPVHNRCDPIGTGNGNEIGTGNGNETGTGNEVGGEIANTTTTTTTFLSFLTWENAVGRPITGFEGQELSSLVGMHGDTWVTNAIQEAARLGKDKVKLRYCERILERWQSEGRASTTEYSTSKKASHKKAETDISPREYIKKYGHLTKRPEE